MPDVMFNGPAGCIEGSFQPPPVRGAPLALILHAHPWMGGTMDNQIVYNLYYTFAERGFSVLRSIFAALGGRKAASITVRENCRTRRPPSTGRRLSIPKRAPAGSRESRLAPGSACNF